MIVLPMAGRSSRFFKAGYTKPKYQLEINEHYSVFDCVLLGFKEYFETEKFCIICLEEARQFVELSLQSLKVKDYEISCLNETTRGQAETVYLGLKNININKNDSALIFNIDTFRPNFKLPSFIDECDGYLEVFKGEGDNWSYAKLDASGDVIETTEKRRISDLCSTGAYYFSDISSFNQAYEFCLEHDQTVNGEFYVAPLYNMLIANKKKIMVDIIDRSDVIFCGVPIEYETLDKQALVELLVNKNS
jgi:hypothetical protein